MKTIREVAKIANVSPATVSRVLNGNVNVSPELEQRVLKVIEETEYVPNEAARTLYKRSSKTVGLIVPSIQNPFFTQFAHAVEKTVKACGYHMFLCSSDNDLQQERAALQQMRAAYVDGVILAATNDEIQKDLAKFPLPIVVADSKLNTTNVNAYVHSNYYLGGKLAVQHLYEDCGCRNIVCIQGAQHIYTARARYEGYRDYCLEHGVAEQTVKCDYDFQTGMEMARELLENFPEVDGIIACDDVVAISTYKVLCSKGISVPEQVQLVGFDDISLSSLIYPELTTIHQPIEEMAQLAVRLILEQKYPKKEGKCVVLPVSLIARQTTKRKNK